MKFPTIATAVFAATVPAYPRAAHATTTELSQNEEDTDVYSELGSQDVLHNEIVAPGTGGGALRAKNDVDMGVLDPRHRRQKGQPEELPDQAMGEGKGLGNGNIFDGVCDGFTGAEKGLCIAYCEAKVCYNYLIFCAAKCLLFSYVY